MSEGFRFGAVSTRAIRDRHVTHAMLRVLAEIATYADQDGWCEVRQSIVGAHLGISRQAVSKHVLALVGHGHLLVEATHGSDGSQRQNRYCVRLDPPATPEVAPPATLEIAGPDTPEVAPRTDLVTRPSEQTPATAVPSSRRRTNPHADVVTLAWWNTRDPKPLQKFVAIRGMVDTCLKAGHDDQAIIDALNDCSHDPPILLWRLEKSLASRRHDPSVQRSHRDPHGLNWDRTGT